MTGSGSSVLGHGILASAMPESEELDTRFGRVTVYPRQSIVFPGGLLGLPDKEHFCVTHFPSEKMARFKLLQSLDDPSLSFITLPVDLENPIVERADLEQAAADLEMPLTSLAVLFIVTVHRDSGAAKLTINARAPIFMNVSGRQAAQYVFSHAKYQIRQPLTM